MKIHHQLAPHKISSNSSLAIGVFDGVHLGHQHLIENLRLVAAHSSRLSGVLTFKNFPASVLSPNFTPHSITELTCRLELITNLGVDMLIPISFNPSIAQLRASEFISVLQEFLGMKDLVVGPDFAMGRNREGDTDMLRSLQGAMGFTLHVVPPLSGPEGTTIRSTLIRDAVSNGEVSLASKLLGRNFHLHGIVKPGDGRGSKIGFPTANLKIPSGMTVPSNGIYATWAHINGHPRMAATSIGVRPTFGKGLRTIETFVLDYTGDLYGRNICLEFVNWIRSEAKFESVEQLQAQIQQDVVCTKSILENPELCSPNRSCSCNECCGP